jgi:hypothetical protein
MSNFPLVPLSGPPQSPPANGEPLRGQVLFGAPPAQQNQQPVLAMLDTVSFVMDRLVEIPGTKIRVGLNTLLLLLPVFGDGISSMVSVAILAIGLSTFRVPRIVAARMMMNALIDSAMGWIPVVGDLFNLWFKADTRNVRLLMEYAGKGDADQPATWKHWLYVIAMGIVFLLIFAAIAACLGVLVYNVIQGFQSLNRSLQVPPPAAHP